MAVTIQKKHYNLGYRDGYDKGADDESGISSQHPRLHLLFLLRQRMLIMKKLIAGEDSTLGNYRKLAATFLGEDSSAVAFLDDKIAEHGSQKEITTKEGQVMDMLINIHMFI